MFIFLTSVIVVSFICFCFFKKKFWENRYLVLAISAGVALVVTLGTNYFTRGKLDTKIETIWANPIQIMSLKDSMLVDSCAFTIDRDAKFSTHFINGDTIAKKTYSHYLFYYADGDGKIGYAQENELEYKYFNDVYIAPSENDTVAYYAKKRLSYAPKSNRWRASFSLPNIKTITCLYIPPSEYACIPDSLIREIPF